MTNRYGECSTKRGDREAGGPCRLLDLFGPVANERVGAFALDVYDLHLVGQRQREAERLLADCIPPKSTRRPMARTANIQMPSEYTSLRPRLANDRGK